MKFVGMYERNIDYVESDHVEPWQAEFDITTLEGNLFVVSVDGGVRTEVFNPSEVTSPVVFSNDGRTPAGVRVIASATDIKVVCTDKYYTRAHLMVWDSTDGATHDEMREVTIDASKLTELGIVADGTVTDSLTGSVNTVGGEIDVSLSAAQAGTSVYVYYVKVSGVKYYGKVPCTIEENTLHMDRFVTMYRYIL